MTENLSPAVAPAQAAAARAAWLAQTFPRHRVILLAVAALLLVWIGWSMRWDWFPQYRYAILRGLGVTLVLFFGTALLGFLLAVPIGLALAIGRPLLAWPCRLFCTVIRGTPLLLQIWFLYYGIGSLLPQFPFIRQSWAWPWLREPWFYAALALSMSFAGYAAEVMRGAFLGVPKGELEAARAFGMGSFKVLRRIWLPRALQRSLPALMGEMVFHLKGTPLVATITIVDLFAVFTQIRQQTYIIYSPLLVLAGIYLLVSMVMLIGLRRFERTGTR